MIGEYFADGADRVKLMKILNKLDYNYLHPIVLLLVD